MENGLREVLLNEDVKIVSVDRVKNSARTKWFLVGASVVAAGWLATYGYKKLKNRKTKETSLLEEVK